MLPADNVCKHSDGILEFFFEKVNFGKKSADNKKACRDIRSIV